MDTRPITMADRLLSLIYPRIVLILSGNHIGTGSFIAPGVILTCAHVVRDAVESGEPVVMRATNEKGEWEREIKVSSVVISQRTEGNEYPDIAIIRSTDQQHRVLRLPARRITYDHMHEYLAVGFQKSDRTTGRNIPQTVSLNYEGEEDAGHLRKIIFENGLVRPGMSGAPLIERDTGICTGIVQKTRNASTDLGAYTIPVEVILRELQELDPKLAKVLAGSRLRRQINREYRAEYPRFPMLRQYGVRLVILPTLLFLALWYVFFHVGQIRNSEVLAALLAVLPFAGKLISDWMGTTGADESAEVRGIVGKLLFHPVSLSLIALLVAGLWLFTTSVRIAADPSESGLAVQFSRYGDSQSRTKTMDDEGRVQFRSLIMPFQSDTVMLQPEGREPVPVEIRSLDRADLIYPDSFQLEPLLVLRLHPDYRNPGWSSFAIRLKVEGSEKELLDSTLPEVNTLIIGNRPHVDIERYRDIWRDELEGVPNAASILEMWMSYKQIRFDLDIGDRVTVALLRRAGGKEFNTQQYALRDDIKHEIIPP